MDETKFRIVTNVKKAQMLMEKGHKCQECFLSERTGHIVFKFFSSEQFIQDWYEVQKEYKDRSAR